MTGPTVSELRLATRLARREVRRHPGRTALVAVLVALPVAFMVFLLVFFRTEDPTQDEAWQRRYGNADAVIEGGTRDVDQLGLPAGARTMPLREMELRVGAGDDVRARVVVYGFPAGDPLVDGLIDLVAGRFPTADHEIALDPDLADDLGVRVGDRLALDRPAPLGLTVVGLAEKPGDLSLPLASTTVDGDLLESDPRRSPTDRTYVDLTDTSTLDDGRGGSAAVLVRGDFIEDAEGISNILLPWVYLLGALVLTVFGIVIAAAFAARSRRQLVMLGQLSANGAPGRVLRSTLILQGTVTGLVGAVMGLVLTLVGVAVGQGLAEELAQHRIDRYDIRPADLAGAVVIGVVAATVAAMVPAWRVERISTLTALAGRRPLRPVRRRVTAAGAVAVAAGVVLMGLAALGAQAGEHGSIWALVGIAGGVLELLGACAVAPAVVSHLEPLAARTRGTWRLAARSLARERARTGAVVSAVAAAAGLAVAGTAMAASSEAREAARPTMSDRVVVAAEVMPPSTRSGTEQFLPLDGAAQAELAGVLRGADRMVLRTAGTQDDWIDNRVPIVADPAVLDGLGFGADVGRAVRQHGLVVLDTGDDVPAEVVLPGGQVRDVASVSSPRSLGNLSGVLASPSLVDELGLEPHDAAVAFVSDRPLTRRQLDAVQDLAEDWQLDTTGYIDVAARFPESGPSAVQLEVILSLVALVFAVLVVGATLALAAAESRDERDVLTVTGVAPRMLARAAAARAWLLAVIGAAMAVPVGLAPVAVVLAADGEDTRFAVPWLAIGLLALALPAVAAVVARLGSGTAQCLRPVRVSTAVFE